MLELSTPRHRLTLCLASALAVQLPAAVHEERKDACHVMHMTLICTCRSAARYKRYEESWSVTCDEACPVARLFQVAFTSLQHLLALLQGRNSCNCTHAR